MSTRRFTVLLAGLSGRSVWRAVASDDLDAITDPEAAERAVLGALGVA